MSNDYIQGPANIIRIAFEASGGYAPHPSCNGLTGYNLTSGYDENRNGLLDSSEISHVDYLCVTNQTIQGGNGAVSNGTVVNGSFQYSQGPIDSGNSTCPFGGKYLVYGNDYGNYYDGNTSLNATETDGTLFNKEATKAIRRWQFKPKVINGIPVEQAGEVEIDFICNA